MDVHFTANFSTKISSGVQMRVLLANCEQFAKAITSNVNRVRQIG